jgi:hypothetical protein
MVTLTRSEAKSAFNHVLDTVLGRDNPLSLKLSLLDEGIDDIFDFITLTESSINSLVYEDPNNTGSFLPVQKGDKMLVKCIHSFDQHLVSQGIPNDYVKLTQQEFESYRISATYRVNVQSLQPTPIPVTSSLSTSLAATHA